ncbi:MAG: hypothetical protein ACRCYU_23410 [Nocardioides sp.]
MLGRRKQTGTITVNRPWWEAAEEVPKAGLPDADALARRARRYRRCVWAGLILAPFSIFGNILLVMSHFTAADTTPAASGGTFAETKAEAKVAIADWLGADPSPLPGGRVVDWLSADTTKSGPDRIETHRFALASVSGALFDSTVTLGVSAEAGVVVLGEPALIPRAPSDATWEGDIWPGQTQVQVSEPIEAAVASWATAYSSGDPDALRIAVGDGAADHAYVPLIGAKLTDQKTGAAFGRWDDDVEVADREDVAPKQVVVSVAFSITWADSPLEEGDEAPTVSFDVLVDKAGSAAPVVVAWGGEGAGPSLKKFGNAVVGRTVAPAPPEKGEEDA